MQRLYYFFFSVLFCFSVELNAQWNTAFYVEGLGDGFIIASLNVDQRLSKENGGLGVRVGFSYVHFDSDQYNIPMSVNYLFGDEKHFLEVGVGAVFIKTAIDFGGYNRFPGGFHGTGSLMYRFHSPSSVFIFRAGITHFTNREGFPPIWPGVSLGFRLFQ